jgi:MraZ protein
MNHFLGEHKVKVDEKGRIKLPASLKQQMNPEANGKFVVNRGFEGCLELYPLDIWIKYRNALQKKINKFNPKHRSFLRRFIGGATELTLDAADRLNFPNHLLKEIEVMDEAYLTPGQDTIELWSVKKYEANVLGMDAETYEDLANEVLGDINLWDDNATE